MPVALPVSPLKSPLWLKALSLFGITLTWLVVGAITVWAVTALYIDIRTPGLRIPLAVAYAVGALVAAIRLRSRIALPLLAAGFVVVLAWWLRLKPTNDGPWAPNNE